MDALTLALLFPIHGFIEIIPKRGRTIIRTKNYEISIPLEADRYFRFSRSGLYKKFGKLKEKRIKAVKLLGRIIECLRPNRAYRLAITIYGVRKVGRFRKIFKPVLEKATRAYILFYNRIPRKLYRHLRRLFGNFKRVVIETNPIKRFVHAILRKLGLSKSISIAGLLLRVEY